MSTDAAWCVACGKMLFGSGAMLCTECGALPPGLRQPVYWDGPTGAASRCRHPERHARDCQCKALDGRRTS